ncbi:hypothetical protein PF008_g32174 [Phytophthora fragariae]|uniref:Uncharacterized protein n=1 Tax=Phytophthora fragariae TaxID=53985 RepID=A0A6G0Q197_9STRA|nr:hypothetical protein PF008_g32174 [Phytophthora fragariae]
MPDQVTPETPATTPAPTIEVEAAAAIATPAGATARSSEPIDAGPSDAGSDPCSDNRGRSSSGYCDSGGRHCTIVSSRLTPGQVTPATTPAPTIEVEAAAAIATPAGATARSCRAD